MNIRFYAPFAVLSTLMMACAPSVPTAQDEASAIAAAKGNPGQADFFDPLTCAGVDSLSFIQADGSVIVNDYRYPAGSAVANAWQERIAQEKREKNCS